MSDYIEIKVQESTTSRMSVLRSHATSLLSLQESAEAENRRWHSIRCTLKVSDDTLRVCQAMHASFLAA